MTMSRFRDSHIEATGRYSGRVDELLNEHFDVVIAASSWDRRSIAIVDAAHVSAEVALLLLFSDRDPYGFRDKHDVELQRYLEKTCKTIVQIEGSSCSVLGLWEKLSDPILRLWQSKGRSLKVLVDLSCVPRYYSLGVLGSLVSEGVVWQVSYLYAEGVYPEETTEADRHEMFTEGGWEAVPIPGLEGEWQADKPWLYLVSVGFEGSKTLRLVSRAEPDQLEVLFPDPPVQDGYVARTRDRNTMLFERFNIGETRITRAGASDAITAWQKLTAVGESSAGQANCILVCCGSKPHSLALALRATTHRELSVHYIIPDRHRVVDVKPNGKYWRYDVRDVTAASSRGEARP